MIESPPAPDDWIKILTTPFGDGDDGWITSYYCIRNEQLAQMRVAWKGSGNDTVDIQVREHPNINPEEAKSEVVIEITVPVTDAKQKIDETAEAWITAIDNN